MAHIGMKYPVAVPWKEGNTYEGAGFVVGKAIQFTGTPNKNDVELYADDEVAETDKSIKDMGTSLNVDDIALEVQANLLGHTYTKATDTEPEGMEIGVDDEAPYFGMGFYKRRKKNGVVSFTVIWLYKVQNSEPTEEASTKGDTTNFQTATIEGKAYPVQLTADNDVKMSVGRKVIFKTEAEAIAWLNKMANITAGGTSNE
jgi:phi13 family phage major tail protein